MSQSAFSCLQEERIPMAVSIKRSFLQYQTKKQAGRNREVFHFFCLYFLIEVELIYNVVLVSGVWQSDSVIYVCTHTHTHINLFFLRFFSTIGY